MCFKQWGTVENRLYNELSRNFDTLLAVASNRLNAEIKYHKLEEVCDKHELVSYLRQFGHMLLPIFRFELYNALTSEIAWFSYTFCNHKWGKDFLSMILDSWIIAIDGVIKMPEATELSLHLKNARKQIDAIFSKKLIVDQPNPDKKVLQLVNCMIEGDYKVAKSLIVKAVNSGTSVADAITTLILPAMNYIGSGWQNNNIKVYQEHLATQTALRLLYALPELKPPKQKASLSALIGCLPGEQHTFIIAALGMYLELSGWKTFPMIDSLTEKLHIEAISNLKPDVIFLSIMMLSRISDALQLIQTIQSKFKSIPVFVGGRATIHSQELFEKYNVTVIKNFEDINALARRVAHHA